MRHERAFLEQVVESLADGNDIDWSALEGHADNAYDKRVLEQLKILARIAEVHRTHAGEPEEDQALSLLRSRGFGLGGKVIPMPVPSPADGPAGAAAAGVNVASAAGVPLNGGAPLPLSATQVAPAPPAQIRWGHLELQERIGEGTFGEVYRARDTQLDREVAVKLLRVGGLSTDRQTRRVLREGRSLARVEHDNVVAVYGAEAHEGRVGLWMELIRGATLEQLLRAHGPFSAREAALIGQDLCSAVAAVHNSGLVHRDIKSQNVMREEGGRLVLMDFGAGQTAGDNAAAIARITGTPLYLAPEVLAGGESTPRSDIYSIGVLLYHLVTNDYPVRANSLQELREAHAQGRRTHLHDARPELPGGLIQVIERALAPDAQRRYQTAGEMQAALDRFLASPDDRDSDDLSWIPMPKPLVARLRRMGRTRALALAVATGIACLGLGAGLAWQMFRHTAVTPGVAGTPSVIAVIDLARGNGVADYEAAGLTEGIHDLLSTSDALRVVSRRSVQVVSQQQLSSPELARRLGADTLIEGRLERVAENYQLSLRLIRAGSDQSVALGTFSAPISQRLGLSHPAAQAVARMLRTPLPATARPRFHASGVLATDAQEKYARARYYLNTAGNWDHRNLSARLFEEAIVIAPDFAEAHSGLARTYYAMINQPRENMGALLAEAHKHAENALRLDSSLSEAHAVLGITAFYDWRWEEAEREFTKAVMLNPSNEFAVERYAMFLAARGRVQEGIAQLTKVRRLDPLSPFVAYSLASLFTYAERYDEALAEVQRARTLDPTDSAMYVVRGRVLAAAGRYDDAIDSFRYALGSVAGVRYALAEIGAAEAGAGRRNEAIRIAQQLEDDTTRDRDERLQPELIGFLYAKLGDNDRAFAWLERAMDERTARMLWLKVDPRAKPLRTDPRFAALLARLELQP